MPKVLKMKVQEISLDRIDEPGGVVRLEIEEGPLIELAENIREVGLLQPIVVRPREDRYEIVAGHRRFLAFRYLDRGCISCIVKDVDDVTCALSRASENLRRVDLSPLEEAAIYEDLHTNLNVSIEKIGKQMGKSSAVVRRRLDLLKMPPILQQAIHKREISWSVGEDLWRMGDMSGIEYYLPFAIEHGATLAVVRGWVKEWKDQRRREESGAPEGGGYRNPSEPKPIYVTCDLCHGAMELGSETVLRVCVACEKVISQVRFES